jgi:hypothetical protein
MTRLQFDVLGLVLTNLPSLVLAAFFARSWWTAVVIGIAPKAILLAALVAMGGGAGYSIEQQAASIAVSLAFAAGFGIVGWLLRLAWKNPRIVGEGIGGLLMLAMWLTLTAGYIFGMWTDARRGNSGYFIADLLIPPFGLVRGVLMLFGWL